MWWRPLIIVTVEFFLSLIGAFVLFKLLKSWAVIKKVAYEVGGAAAGFIIIFLMLNNAVDNYMDKQNRLTHWTVVGYVKKDDINNYDGIIVAIQPPQIFTLTDAGGCFRLENIPVIGGGLPELRFESDGYFPMGSYKLGENNTNVDYDTKRITVNDTIELYKMPD